jgi:hypothetical protein
LEAFSSYGQSYPRTTPTTPLHDRPSFINIYNYTNIFITSPAAAPDLVPASFSAFSSFVNPMPPGATAAHPTSHTRRM